MRTGKWSLVAFVTALVVAGTMVASCGGDSDDEGDLVTFQCQAVCQTPSGVLGGDSASFDGRDEDAAAAECVEDQSSAGNLCESVGGTFAGRCSCF
ncbi:MAG: hypothetical protein IPK07_17295 [Deltaproteobacteria bacterium]|nr:hypothetical protein [Deltaproteobacteria bacterium]